MVSEENERRENRGSVRISPAGINYSETKPKPKSDSSGFGECREWE